MTKDGFPSPYINNLYQDSNNKLWVATNAGLVSYDGYDFYHYTAQEGLSSEVIYDMVEDKDGTLWIAGNKGIHILNDDSFTPLHWDIPMSHIEMDTMGNIWVSNGGGLYFYTPKSIKKHFEKNEIKKLLPQKFEEDNPKDILNMKCDGNGNLFISEGSGICFIDKNKCVQKIYTHPNTGEYITELLPISADSVYWSTKEGSTYLTTKQNTSPRYLVDLLNYPGASDLAKWNSKTCLLTNFSLLSFSENQKDELIFPEEWNIKQLRCMLPDDKGNLWVGTSEGLILVTPRLFHQKKYNHSEIYSIHKHENELLVGANHGEIFKYSPKNGFENFSKHKLVPRGEIMDMMTDLEGGLWVVSFWRGASRWHNGRVQRIFYGNLSEDEPDLNCILQSSDSTIWVGGINCIYKIKMNWKTGIPDLIEKIQMERKTCYQLFSDDEGGVWASTSEGLYFIKNNNPTLVKISGIPQNIGIKDARWINGKLWLATQGLGVAICEKNKKKELQLSRLLTVREGLINNFVYCLEQDGEGNIWAGTLAGLSRINLNNNFIIHNYAQDGLTEKPYFNITLFKDENDLMWCATSYGIFSFDPKLFDISKNETTSHFTQIELNGEKLHTPQKAKFKYYQNTLQFNFLHINTTHSELIRYRYRLKGLDDNWSIPSDKREVKYDFLPPNVYQFEVKTGDSQGKWSTNILKYPFEIAPPFWKTTWFRSLSIFTIGFLLWGFVRWRETGIREKERERSRFHQLIAELESRALRAQMNPHFIFNCMNAIQEQILLNNSDNAFSYLSKFAKLMRMILDSSATHEVKIGEEIAMLNLYLELEALRFDDAFQYKIHQESDIEYLMIPGLMIQPFVENAIWHGLLHQTGERILEINFKTENDYIICTVKDNGVGREKAKSISAIRPKSHQSQALRLIYERLDLINSKSPEKAKLEIQDLKNENQIPNGTLIKLLIPINWQNYWTDENNK